MSDRGGIKGGIANAIFSIRPLILLVFLIGTAFMAFHLAQLRVDSGFKKQLPLDHEYMQTFQFYEEFGGANRILFSLMDRDGDMFTPEFFRAFEEISNRVFLLPGVDRASVRSIFTPNVRFVEVVEDGSIVLTPLQYRDPAQTRLHALEQQEFEHLPLIPERYSPFLVVVADIDRIVATPVTALRRVFGFVHCAWLMVKDVVGGASFGTGPPPHCGYARMRV